MLKAPNQHASLQWKVDKVMAAPCSWDRSARKLAVFLCSAAAKLMRSPAEGGEGGGGEGGLQRRVCVKQGVVESCQGSMCGRRFAARAGHSNVTGGTASCRTCLPFACAITLAAGAAVVRVVVKGVA